MSEPAPYTLVEDLARKVRPPTDGILSSTIHQDERVKAVAFAFGAGQELSEHTSAVPAILQFLQGEATLTLGGEARDAGPGTFVHMPAGLRHAVHAKTPTVMLLILLR